MDKHSSENQHEHERKPEFVEQASTEHIDKLRALNHHEFEKPDTREKDIETAQVEALEHAARHEHTGHHQSHDIDPPIEKRLGPITKKQLDHKFDDTMNQVQQEMPASKRAFSKLIHNKAVEKTSDALAATIARPNALFAGSVGAFTLTLGVYIFAKTMGYTLSGFEPIAAFIIGWLGGFFYDYLKVMATGKKS